jgi:hypothetical protein
MHYNEGRSGMKSRFCLLLPTLALLASFLGDGTPWPR